MNLDEDGYLDAEMVTRIAKLFYIEIVDMKLIFGPSINRAANKRKVRQNLRVYYPVKMKWGDKLPMTVRLLVKITTPIKLNLVNKDG